MVIYYKLFHFNQVQISTLDKYNTGTLAKYNISTLAKYNIDTLAKQGVIACLGFIK